MDPYLVFCNKCFTTLPSSRSIQFFITSCGVIVCQKCTLPPGDCFKCGRNCPKKAISKDMSSDIAILFRDTQTEIKRIQNAQLFQLNRYKLNLKYQSSRMTSLERAYQQLKRECTALREENKKFKVSMENLKLKVQQNQSYLPVINENRSPNKKAPVSSSFANSVMNAITQQNNEPLDDTINLNTSQGNFSGIFPRNSFENSSNRSPTRSIGKLTRTVRFEESFTRSPNAAAIDVPNHQLNYQSTPLIGQRIGGLQTFGIRKPSSSIYAPTSSRYRL